MILSRKRTNPVSSEEQEQFLFRGSKRGKEDGVNDSSNDVLCSTCSTTAPLKDLGLCRFPTQWSWKCTACTIKNRMLYIPFPLAPANRPEE